MSYENGMNLQTFEASADLSAQQHMAMTLDSSKQLDEAASTETCIGILQNKPAAQGRAGSVAVVGSICKAQVTGTIAVMDRLGVSPITAGVLVTTTLDTINYIATALEARTGDGTTGTISVLVTPGMVAA